MTRTRSDALSWAREGFATFVTLATALDDSDWPEPSALPGWSRKHLVAHVAANADALSNLVRWAATGIPTPMYASPEQRGHDIETGASRTPTELIDWLASSEQHLQEAMAALSDKEWCRQVQTAQGRSLQGSEIPWLRSREVWVHSVDLATSCTFESLPTDFLHSLAEDIVEKRRPAGTVPVTVSSGSERWDLPGPGKSTCASGELHQVVAYLAGRPSQLLTVDGSHPPALGPWL